MKFPAYLVAGALLLGALPAHADEITLLDGRVIEGVRVQSETFEKITYRRAGGGNRDLDVPSGDVRSVSYSRTSENYRSGLEKIAEGDNTVGASLLYSATDNEQLPDYVRANAFIEAADALLANGNLEDALGLYDGLLTTYPTTRHLARALVGKGKAALYSQDTATALAAFAKLKAEAASKGFGERWSLEGEFYELQATQTAGGSASDAVKGYRDLRSRAASGYPSIASNCALMIGRTLLGQDDVQSALPHFNDIIELRLDSDRDVAAGAYNGRGRCIFALAERLRDNGDGEGAKEEFAAARLDFLRVHVHYPDVQGAQPEALYWAAESFLNVGDADADLQAAVLRKRLMDRYPSTDWAQKVQR